MSDMKLTLRLSTEGGKVVVRDISDVAAATDDANKKLQDTATAGRDAQTGLTAAADGAGELDKHMNLLKATLGVVGAGLASLQLAGFLQDGIAENQELNRNLMRTESVIQSMGNAAGITAQELARQAREIAESTRSAYDVDSIMRAQQVLLTYSTVVGQTFKDSIDLAVDLSALMGGDVVRSVEQLGRALDDPIKGIQALADSGYRFADSQKAMWKEMAETGRLQEAQTEIIAELRMQVGGLARNELTDLERAQKRYGLILGDTKGLVVERLALEERMAAAYGEITSALELVNAAISNGDLKELSADMQAAIQTAQLFAQILVGAGVLALGKYAFAQLMVIQGKLLLNTQAVNTVGVLGVVATRAGTTTVAMNALGIATKLALGPIGLITAALGVAATAFFTYKSAAEEAKSETDAFVDSVNRMSNAAKANEYVRVQTQLIELARERIKAEQDLQNAQQQTSNSSFGNVGAITRAAKRLADLSAQEKELSERLAVLNKNFEDGLPGLETYSELTEDNTVSATEFNTALLSLYNTQKLAAEAVDAHGRALTGIDFEIYKAQFKEVGQLPADAEAAIKAFVKTAQAAAAVTAADNALKDLRAETELLKVRLALGEKEYAVQKALAQLKGGDPAVLAAIEAEIRLQQDLNELIANSEEIASEAWGNMLDSMTALSTAAGGVGDILVQAFGRVAQQLDAMTAAQERYAANMKKLAEEKKKIDAMPAGAERAAAEVKYQQTLSRLHRENTQAQLGQFASLTGAAKNMFSEQSKGREALHRMEMVFSAAELAMSIKASGANALKAITEAFAAPFPLNFASGAAMMAIMAGLGVFSGGSSVSAPSAAERQRTQGTGTVLGDTDAKSESIVNALDRIAELSLDQYSELRAINQSIRELNQGIAQLAVNLVRSFGRFDSASYQGALGTEKQFQLGSGLSSFVAGGVIGLGLDKLLDGMIGGIFNSILGGISKTTRNLMDSGLSFEAAKIGEILATGLLEGSYYNVIETTKRKLWGLSKKTSTSTEFSELDRAIEAEFGRVFGFLATSITGAVDMLGLDLNKSLNDFVISLPNISFKDLSGDEIQKELEAIFSQQADLMVQYLVPSMAEYQKMGEGLYDTLIRVAQEQAIFNAQLDALGLQLSRFGDIAAETQIAVAQSIIELMGGIEQFRDLTGQYFSAFYSESEQFEFLSRSLNQAFADLGLALPDLRDDFKELVSGIDITTDAGQALFAQLMQLVPGLDEYYKALQRQKDAAEKAAEAERKLAEQRAAFDAVNQRELVRFDMSPLQRAIDDLNEWYQSAIADAKELGADTGLLDALYSRRRDALAEQTLQQALDAANNAMTRLVADYERASGALQNTLTQQTNAINNMVNTIAGTIISIQQTLPGFDNIAFLRGRVAELNGQIGSGSIDEQLRLVGDLQSAIQARYNAELAANRELQTAAQNRISSLQSELEQLSSGYESAAASLQSAFDQIVGRINSAAQSVAQTATQIRLSMPGSDAAGYYANLVAQLQRQLGSGDINDQLGLVAQLQSAIQARYNAEIAANRELQSAANARLTSLNSELQQITREYDNAAASLQSAFDQLVERITSAAQSVAQTATQIRLSMPGADAVGYYASLVAQLQSQFGSGDINDQLGLVAQLQSAIQSRYNAELQQLNEVQRAADEQYQQQMQQYNTALSTYKELTKAAEALKKAAAALQIGNLSPLTTGERLTETRSQLDDALQRAFGGDAAAFSDVQQLGQRFLELSREFSPASYQSAFDFINDIFNQLGDVTPVEPTAPRPHAEQAEYELQQIALAEAAIAELLQLQQLTQSLQSSANATLQTELQQLQNTFNANSAAVNAQIVAATSELAGLEREQISLANAAIAELQQLQQQTQSLQSSANATLQTELQQLQNTFNANTTAVNTQIQAAQDELATLEREQIELANDAIAELTALQAIVAALQTLSDNEYKTGIDMLKAQFSADSDKILSNFEASIAQLRELMPVETDRVIEKMQQQIDAVYAMSNDVTGAIRELPAIAEIPDITVPEIVMPDALLPAEVLDPLLYYWEPVPGLLQNTIDGINRLPTSYPIFDTAPIVNTLQAVDTAIRAAPPPAVAVNVDINAVVRELQEQRQQTAVIAQRQEQLQAQQQLQLTELRQATERFGREVVDLSNDSLTARRLA